MAAVLLGAAAAVSGGAVAATSGGAATATNHPLPRVSVSGQSAGGSMAIQHLVAFTSTVDGCAIAGGSPYGCSVLKREDSACYYGLTKPDVQTTIKYVRDRFEQGAIDDPKNLTTIPVVLFNGKNDWVVYTEVMRDTQQQLAAFVDEGMLHPRFDTAAGHVWSVDQGCCRCGTCIDGGTAPEPECCDVNNCGYDLSGDVLSRAYGGVKPRQKAAQELLWVQQWQYVPAPHHSYSYGGDAAEEVGEGSGGGHAHMLKWAIVYAPHRCRGNVSACRVHVNYHGCMNKDWPGRSLWTTSLDLNEYAEVPRARVDAQRCRLLTCKRHDCGWQANDMIVLYPQSAGSKNAGKGCWNWDSCARPSRHPAARIER
jgi:hypothetical protein